MLVLLSFAIILYSYIFSWIFGCFNVIHKT